MPQLRTYGISLAVLGLLTLSACGSTPDGQAAETNADSELSVVTSTDVYASLVSEITTDTADVEPLVASAATDPHSYEASGQDRLKVENADVIVANGAGYDSFITLLAEAADKEDAVYQVADADHGHDHDHEHSHDHGHDHDHQHGYANEHFWYDLQRMEQFVVELGEHLGEVAPEHADQYADSAEDLADQIGELVQRNQNLDAGGHSYLATEAVSGFMLEAAGFEDMTDPDFLSAVEHGNDVSPRLYRDAMQRASTVDLLSYNSQTETQQSSDIRAAAEESGATVIDFTETLPESATGYVDWMESNLDAVDDAIGAQQ